MYFCSVVIVLDIWPSSQCPTSDKWSVAVEWPLYFRCWPLAVSVHQWRERGVHQCGDWHPECVRVNSAGRTEDWSALMSGQSPPHSRLHPGLAQVCKLIGGHNYLECCFNNIPVQQNTCMGLQS